MNEREKCKTSNSKFIEKKKNRGKEEPKRERKSWKKNNSEIEKKIGEKKSNDVNLLVVVDCLKGRCNIGITWTYKKEKNKV